MTAERSPSFEALFGRAPAAAGEAPGRANLIGEHTDYNGGLVMPTALPQRTCVEVAPRRDGRVFVWSAIDGPGSAPLSYELGAEEPAGDWLDYVRGATLAARRAGWALAGFEGRVSSDVPVGAGVSSSAALEVALLRALREAFAVGADDLALARVAHAGEVALTGARVGLLDPLACAFGREGAALFIDLRELQPEILPLPADAELAVVHSGIRHAHATGAYNRRREECERAARLLGVAELRDVALEDLPRTGRLPDPLGARVRHVVTENARVLAAREALLAGAADELGRILDEGQVSLRDDFDVSLPEVDLLAALCRAQPGVHGARLTGGGFGGAVVLVARRGSGGPAAERAATAYAARTGRAPVVLVPPPVPGRAA